MDKLLNYCKTTVASNFSKAFLKVFYRLLRGLKHPMHGLSIQCKSDGIIIFSRTQKKLKQAWTNFFLGARFWFLTARSIGHAKMGAQNQSARLIETELETLLFSLYYLNSSYSFHFNVFSSKCSTMRLL